jgi:hypothetical protein
MRAYSTKRVCQCPMCKMPSKVKRRYDDRGSVRMRIKAETRKALAEYEQGLVEEENLKLNTVCHFMGWTHDNYSIQELMAWYGDKACA